MLTLDVVIFAFAIFAHQKTVSATVSSCYHCNSVFCGDTYDTKLAAIASCSDIYRNAQLYSSRIVASGVASGILNSDYNDTLVGTDNSADIETMISEDTNEVIRHRTHSQFFDIERKIWELFKKKDIDENTPFVCVKANYNYDNQLKTYRGCVPQYTKTLSTACDFVKQRVTGASSGTVYACNTCNTDLCNNAVGFGTSFLTCLMGIVTKFII